MGEENWVQKPSYFKRRKNEVKAIRVTEENAKEVAKWCGGQALKVAKQSYVVNTDEPILKVPTLDVPLMVYSGEWLLKDEDGRFSLMENKEFIAEYEFYKEKETAGLPQENTSGAR